MALSFGEQYNIAMSAIGTGDIELLSRLITTPNSITVAENRTLAESLGLKNRFLKFAVNTAGDPLVWLSALMSRRFPVSMYLKGTINQRHIGIANEFGGGSAMFRPLEGWQRGTNVPKLLALAQQRHQKVIDTAAPWFDEIQRRNNWKAEMPVVSLLMEGHNPAAATPELRGLAKKLLANMNDMGGFLMQAQNVRGGQDGTLARVEPWPANKQPKWLRDYLPHIPLRGPDAEYTLVGDEAIKRLAGNRNVKQMLELKNAPLPWSVDKTGQITSKFHEFQRWVGTVGADVYNPHLFKRVRHGIPLESLKGHELFYTDLDVVLQRYVSSVAKTYALNAPLSLKERAIASSLVQDANGVQRRIRPSEMPILAQVINEGLNNAGVKITRQRIPLDKAKGTFRTVERVEPGTGSLPMLKSLDTLVRQLKGGIGEDEIWFGGMFNKIYGSLEAIKARVTRTELNDMTAAVASLQRSSNYRQKTDGITSWMYTTTLGLNPLSALKNLFQPIITTAPALGIGPTIRGMGDFARKYKGFVADVTAGSFQIASDIKGAPRMVEKVRLALRKNFPELVDARLDVDPRAFDIDEKQMRKFISTRGKFVDSESMQKFMLAPFAQAEFANRATTFYATRHALKHHIRTGEYQLPDIDGRQMKPAEIDEFLNFEAANVVNATQFRPGPGTKTMLQSMLPGPLRQFTTFPIRLANFFADSTIRGAMSDKAISEMGTLSRLVTLRGRNLGTVARTVLYSKIAVNGFRDVLGLDVSDAVGLSVPFTPAPENQPFAPFPIPPLPSAIIGTISAFATRDIKRLSPLRLPGGVSMPLPKTLFPGGIQLNRMFRAIDQFRPDQGTFVDEHERTIFRGDTFDMIMSGMGVPLDKLRRERQIMERLHANRSAMRQFGREFRSAASRFDFDEMDSVKQRYAEAFPDMPPLSASSRDMVRFREGQRRTRIQRMIGTFPAAARFMEGDVFRINPDLIEPEVAFGDLGQ